MSRRDNSGPLAPCGTRSAYQRHRRRGERPCDACREANTVYIREHGGHRPDEEYARQPCGTFAAYERHRYYGEDACQPCLDACAAYARERRRAARSESAVR